MRRISYTLSLLGLLVFLGVAHAGESLALTASNDSVFTIRYKGKVYQIKEQDKQTEVSIFSNDRTPIEKQTPFYHGVYRSGKEMARLEREGWIKWPLASRTKQQRPHRVYLSFVDNFKVGTILSDNALFAHDNALMVTHWQTELLSVVYSYQGKLSVRAGVGTDSRYWKWTNDYTIEAQENYLSEKKMDPSENISQSKYSLESISLPITLSYKPTKRWTLSAQCIPMYRYSEKMRFSHYNRCSTDRKPVKVATPWAYEVGGSISYSGVGLYVLYAPQERFINSTKMPSKGMTTVGMVIPF